MNYQNLHAFLELFLQLIALLLQQREVQKEDK